MSDVVLERLAAEVPDPGHDLIVKASQHDVVAHSKQPEPSRGESQPESCVMHQLGGSLEIRLGVGDGPGIHHPRR